MVTIIPIIVYYSSYTVCIYLGLCSLATLHNGDNNPIYCSSLPQQNNSQETVSGTARFIKPYQDPVTKCT